MSWLGNIFGLSSGKNVDFAALQKKLQSADKHTTVSNADLEAYTDDIENRVKQMTKDLKGIYTRFGITFNGFKSFKIACAAIRTSINNGTEESYNNLIKTESSIAAELKRHLGLIRMAVAPDGGKVMDKINQDPRIREKFNKIFGKRSDEDTLSTDGTYQRLWSEVHKVAEYIIIQKDRVLH